MIFDHCSSLFPCTSSHPLSVAFLLPSTIIIIIIQIVKKDPVLVQSYSYHSLLHLNEIMWSNQVLTEEYTQYKVTLVSHAGCKSLYVICIECISPNFSHLELNILLQLIIWMPFKVDRQSSTSRVWFFSVILDICLRLRCSNHTISKLGIKAKIGKMKSRP